MMTFLLLISACIWLCILFLPWCPWSTGETLEARPDKADADLSDITVLIPARNEAEHVAATLQGVASQSIDLRVILIDDQSTDNTAEYAQAVKLPHLSIVSGTSLPKEWTGKLWALQQGLALVETKYVLLLDADIELQEGVLAGLKNKLQHEQLQFVSLTARLRMVSFWERLLMPAFVYFFKLLYPFALSNDPRFPKMAAAAGGCILTEAAVLHRIGGFENLKSEIIDDCSLALLVKTQGYKTWVGLTHGVRSQREYADLRSIWEMVARTAYTQLRYSIVLLLTVSLLMLLMYWLPLLGLLTLGAQLKLITLFCILVMLFTYKPVLNYYQLPFFWALLLPVITTFFLVMTWSSAYHYWRGRRSAWKDRHYYRSDEETAV